MSLDALRINAGILCDGQCRFPGIDGFKNNFIGIDPATILRFPEADRQIGKSGIVLLMGFQHDRFDLRRPRQLRLDVSGCLAIHGRKADLIRI